MSSKTVVFSRANPYQFSEEGLTLSPNYGYPGPNKALVGEVLKPNQVDTNFHYIATYAQRICLQVHRPVTAVNPTANWNQLIITDECGKALKTLNYSSATSETDYALDTGEKLYTDQFQFKFSQFEELDGYDVVRLKLRVHFGDNTDRYFITNM